MLTIYYGMEREVKSLGPYESSKFLCGLFDARHFALLLMEHFELHHQAQHPPNGNRSFRGTCDTSEIQRPKRNCDSASTVSSKPLVYGTVYNASTACQCLRCCRGQWRTLSSVRDLNLLQ
ncbi:hypothetical protein FOXB_00438 [Fusarium oxysporum f. sp. conglutinans Fo5176]|uniref:Uncharacterized protein n=1 Tax=Fusarium oxysporum (strain Fo5176) TaxID=660025 RepID=F9F214_FUSOF|nr:hypothetical protein FOXB_00438 [Fusarium oxysporum f. sp. conglutinans Fo5176]